jgi:hypothetical protein
MVMEKVINLSSYIDRIGPAEYLVQEAVSKGSGDDQTALVLDLNKYRKGLLKPHHATFSGVSPLERTIKKGNTRHTRHTRHTQLALTAFACASVCAAQVSSCRIGSVA